MKLVYILLFVTIAVYNCKCDNEHDDDASPVFPPPPPPQRDAEDVDDEPQSFIDEKLITHFYDPKACQLLPEPSWDEFQKFFEFKKKFNKVYKTAEIEKCKAVRVIYHIREIEFYNKLYDEGKVSFRRDLTAYSDMSHDEKMETLMMKDLPPVTHYRQAPANLPDLPPARPYVNYVEEGLVLPSGFQSKCGSCYAWSGSAALEAQLIRCNIFNERVSVQQMVDCPTIGVWGCSSGWPFYVYKWQQNAGIVPESKYPYRDAIGNCTYNKDDIVAYINKPFKFDFTAVNGNESFIRQVVSAIGPVATIICVQKGMMQYKSGIYDVPSCCTQIKHAVTIVGYGTDPVGGDYWLVKNSWGSWWGDNGIGKIARGKNLCIMETQIQYAQVRSVDGKVCEFPYQQK